jgi:hypothetical protein
MVSADHLLGTTDSHHGTILQTSIITADIFFHWTIEVLFFMDGKMDCLFFWNITTGSIGEHWLQGNGTYGILWKRLPITVIWCPVFQRKMEPRNRSPYERGYKTLLIICESYFCRLPIAINQWLILLIAKCLSNK